LSSATKVEIFAREDEILAGNDEIITTQETPQPDSI
jgi:hypothetical protein